MLSKQATNEIAEAARTSSVFLKRLSNAPAPGVADGRNIFFQTALELADALYGGEGNLITINMSEFQEAHTVSTLKGAPPGYVGYGEGGILTEAVRRKPYSVVLLDEMEKEHPEVHEIFFQVFDKGWMEDGEGRRINFRNCVIIMTSNAGSDLVMNMCKDSDLLPSVEGLAEAMRPALLKAFPAALLG
jgi:type VI secretion system protein VasG